MFYTFVVIHINRMIQVYKKARVTRQTHNAMTWASALFTAPSKASDCPQTHLDINRLLTSGLVTENDKLESLEFS